MCTLDIFQTTQEVRTENSVRGFFFTLPQHRDTKEKHVNSPHCCCRRSHRDAGFTIFVDVVRQTRTLRACVSSALQRTNTFSRNLLPTFSSTNLLVRPRPALSGCSMASDRVGPACWCCSCICPSPPSMRTYVRVSSVCVCVSGRLGERERERDLIMLLFIPAVVPPQRADVCCARLIAHLPQFEDSSPHFVF